MIQKVKTICLVLIILAVFAGIGFFWYQWQEEKKNKEEFSTCAAWCNFYYQEIKGLDHCLESCKINPNFFKYLKTD